MAKLAQNPRRSRLVLLAAFALAAWLAPTEASAEIELEFTELRSAELPVAANGALYTSTDDGRTVIANTTGDTPETAACTVVVIESGGATSYEYSNGPTACVGLLPHPDGGFFLRTNDPTADPEADPPVPAGATVRIDADGNEVWALDDQALVDALPESENGTGEFLGQYSRPVPLMAYSAQFDKLLAFTNGVLNIGGGSRLAQAHVVDADDGELRESGQTFGEDAGGRLAALTTRESDGYFVLAILRAGTDGANFYSYNGRSNIDFFEPVGEQWDERNVKGIAYDQQSNFYIMWIEGEGENATTNLTAGGPDESLLWNSSYDPNVSVGGQDINIGEPVGFWVGSRYTVVLHRKGAQVLLRVVDVLDGTDLGVTVLEPPSGYIPITILNGEQQRLKLVSYDESNNRVVEYEISVSESDGGGGEDAGGADGGDDSGGGNGGCGCTSSDQAPLPIGGALLAVIGLLGLRLRRAQRA